MSKEARMRARGDHATSGVLDMYDTVPINAEVSKMDSLQLFPRHGLDWIPPDLCDVHKHPLYRVGSQIPAEPYRLTRHRQVETTGRSLHTTIDHPSGQPHILEVADVKALVNAGLADEVIISQIKQSRIMYHLTTATIIDLKQGGVSDRVIDFMINTASQ
jgi:hypothetical protein